MNKLIEIGETFLGATPSQKHALIDYYNENCIDLVKPSRKYKMKYDDEWCSMFTSVVAHKAGDSRHAFPYEVSVYQQCLLAKDRGQYLKGAGEAAIGDLIVYDWLGNGGYDHVGFVANVSPDTIKALEGNKGDTVAYRNVNRRSRVIKAIIRLGNDQATSTDNDQATSTDNDQATSTDKRLETLAKRVLKGELGNGDARRVALGDDYMAVQRIVNTLLAE
jgi:signal peptidase I